MIVFEFPLNERVRTWLRLEDLFDKTLFFMQATDTRSHHAALLALFELTDVISRPELRSELLQELERQKSTLETLRSNPAVDHTLLDSLLDDLGAVMAELLAQTGKPGQHIRENDWLASIKNRAGIPGGMCSFDLPGYHLWLNTDPPRRLADLQDWLRPYVSIRKAVELVLHLLRESGRTTQHTAAQGMFQLMLGGKTAHLIRVAMEGEQLCAPEVSANKYAVNIRFAVADRYQKPRTCDRDVPFQLTFCSLGGSPVITSSTVAAVTA